MFFEIYFSRLDEKTELLNATIYAKEEQLIEADILALEKMSKFEQNVRNLSDQVSTNQVETSKASNVVEKSVARLKASVKTFLNFFRDLISPIDDPGPEQLESGNLTVRFAFDLGH